MIAKELQDVLDEIAAEVTIADVSSAALLSKVLGLFDTLEAGLGSDQAEARALVATGKDNLELLVAGTAPDPDAALDEVTRAVTALERAFAAARRPASQAPAPSAAPACVETTFVRDAETVSLIGEFLLEAGDGLSRADEILLAFESGPAEAEAINELFRVFHTIKGVAGFLELNDVQSLAHHTETVLNKVRQNETPLTEAILDAVLDATAVMREMLAEVRAAVDECRVVARHAAFDALIRKLEASVQAGAAPAVPPPPPVEEPHKRLGEILTEPPFGVPQAAIDDALEKQQRSGNKLGEELIAAGVVAPKDVANALRAQATAGAKVREVLKVDLERVDSLVETIGELVIVESMLVNALEIVGLSAPRVRKHLAQMGNLTRNLQDLGMRMRMVPVRGLFQKMTRLVRDLSHKSTRQVRIVLSGESTEMDRSMVEQIADPLVHMIRNSVDHGIEPPDVRVAKGKPAHGTISLSASHRGGSVVVELSDDGKGLDRDVILRKAMEKGLVKDGSKLSDEEAYNLIFVPGFSTAAQVTEISGRGVGMDVVRRNVEAMRGRIFITSTPGRGTTFTLVLPLTLAIIDGMQVACGGKQYIIPTLSIVELVQPDAVFTQAGMRELVSIRGETMPLFRLDRLFDIPDAKSNPTEALVVVVESLGRKVGLMVDDVVTQQQVVIKSLGSGFKHLKFVAGATILSDGKVGLILNMDELMALLDRSRSGIGRHRESGAEQSLAPCA